MEIEQAINIIIRMGLVGLIVHKIFDRRSFYIFIGPALA